MRHSHAKAFTLVELLVVIGVIAVLVAMLLPALNKARASANAVACESNLKQMGMAFAMYLNEYKKYPNFRWPEAICPYLHGTIHGSAQLPELGTNVNLDKVTPLNLIHCPALPDSLRGQKLTLTYAMNGINTNANFWKMLCIGGQSNETLLPHVAPARVRRPAEFGVLTEMWKTDGPEQSCWSTTWWRLFSGNNFTALFVHPKRSNVLFADFHVEPLVCAPTGKDPGSGLLMVSDQNDALFNYDYAAFRNGGVGKPSKYLK
jgi:prepilin-type processing-associated H-X9-DG protein/prepilin-type N-terminal cleavage/methylation domain-containing protein